MNRKLQVWHKSALQRFTDDPAKLRQDSSLPNQYIAKIHLIYDRKALMSNDYVLKIYTKDTSQELNFRVPSPIPNDTEAVRQPVDKCQYLKTQPLTIQRCVNFICERPALIRTFRS